MPVTNIYVNVMQQAAKVKSRVPDGLQYPFAEPPPPGKLREVAPGVYWLRMPLPFALEHIAQQTMFAMGETLSHINFLHSRGQLQRARGDDGIYRYARV